MIYSREVEEMCPVAQGVHHGAAPIPEEAKWVQAKEVKDISGLTHGVGWCAPQQGACKLSLNVKNGIIEEALVETIGCSGMTHSAAMAAEVLQGKTILEALNTDLVCDAINTAMRELFLQIVYGRTQSAFSENGLPVGAGLEDLGKGTRSQVGTVYSTKVKGPRYLDLAEGYIPVSYTHLLGIPTIIADMIDVGVMNADTDYIIRMGFVVLLISLIGVSMTILLGYCCAKISTAITRDIRNDIFDHAQRFTAYEFNRFGISSMITRTNNDAFQIQMFVNVLLRTALMTPIMFVASIIMTARASLPLSGIIVATIPLIIIGVFVVAKISKPISENQQASLDSLNRISRENLSGIRVIRAFDNDAYEQRRFDDTNGKFTDYSKKLFKLMMMTSPIFFLLMNVAGLCIYWVAALLIQGGDLPLGQLVAFMDYLFHAMFSIMLFCTVFMMYPRAEVSAKRIEAVFDTVPLVHNDGKRKEGSQEGTISFEHVTFVYPDGEEPVLKDVSFTAKKGETIAFIGSTGSGKSTLVNLIPRFYDVSEGSIRIDGVDIRDYDLFELRSRQMCIRDRYRMSGDRGFP